MATSNDSDTKQLEEFVTCAICLDLYKDPRLLPCSHTFCFECIQRLVSNDAFNCPLQDDMKITQNDINRLPVNRIAKDMVDFVLNMNIFNNKNTSHSCDNCSENQGVNWCDVCATHLCDLCTKSIHSMKIFQSHTIVSASDKTQSYCKDHSDEKFKYWCNQCEVLVCRDCLLFKHKDHKCLPLKDAATEAKTKFRETVQQIDEIKTNLTQLLDTTKSVTDQQRDIVHHQKQDVEETFAALQHALEERKSIIIKQLEDKELETMKVLDERQNAIDQHLNLTIAQELCVKKILNPDDSMQILKFKSTLSHNYKGFIEQYKKIDAGYTMTQHSFEKGDTDFEQILEKISKLGSITNKSYLVKRDGMAIKTSSLNISRPIGSTMFTAREFNVARGYRISLDQSLKLRSIQIQSNHIGQLVGFVVNESGIVIQNGTINPSSGAMQWLTIPLNCDLKNNYIVLVWASLGDGSYTYKNGDVRARMINQHCSVESKYVTRLSDANIGSKINVECNAWSIDMILNIED